VVFKVCWYGWDHFDLSQKNYFLDKSYFFFCKQPRAKKHTSHTSKHKKSICRDIAEKRIDPAAAGFKTPGAIG